MKNDIPVQDIRNVKWKEWAQHLKFKIDRVRRYLDAKLTASFGTQLGLFAVVFGIALLLLSMLYMLTGAGGLLQTLADILGPDQFINYAHPTDGIITTSPIIMLVTIVAGLIGAIIFQGLLIATIINIIQTRADKVKQGDMEYKFKNHVLILGYNDNIVNIIKKISEQVTDIVIAVEKDVQLIREKLLMQLDDKALNRITLLHANRTQEDDLQRLNIAQAQQVYIIGENNESIHDIRNMECYNMISPYKVDSYVYLKEQDFFNLIAQYGPNDVAHFHMFNYEELWCRKVLVEVSEDNPREMKLDYRNEEDNISKCMGKQVHLVIVGMTEMGEALAREAAFVAHYPNFITHQIRTKITLIDPDMERKMKSFVGRHQTFFQHCHYNCIWWDERRTEQTCSNTIKQQNDFLDLEFEFIKADAMDYHVLKLLKEWSADQTNQYLNIFFCQQSEEDNFCNSLRLPTEVYMSGAPIWVYGEHQTDFNVLVHKRFNKIKSFGSPDVSINDNNTELRWAKCVNEIYRGLYNGPEWKDLPISERWSNMYNALSLPFKLRSIGAEYRNGKILNVDLPDDMNCLLGEVEHNRWNAEKLLLSYRSAIEGETKDKGNFIHTNIKRFNDLNDTEKEFDKELLEKLIKYINNNEMFFDDR